MANENKGYKDSVFTDLFYSDKYATENLLQLYNALYGTNFKDPAIIEKCRLEDVIFMNFKNDLAALFGQKRLFLAEQQSTVNYNMPLRMLMYVAREYEKLVHAKLRYRKSLVKIPMPQFITFYNGKEKFPAEKILRLSDAFMDATNEPPKLELEVKVININTGANTDILKKCNVLREYSQFIETARECKASNADTGLKDAIKKCINAGILSEYLSRKSVEVVNMLMAEYSYAEDIAENRNEAREEGRNQTLKIIRYIRNNPNDTDDEVAKKCNSTSQEVALIRQGIFNIL